MVELQDRIVALMWNKMVSEHHATAALNRQTEYQAKDGWGGDSLRVPRNEFFAAMAKYGKDCWFDRDFQKAWARDNPGLVARCTRGTRGQEYAGTRYLTKPLPKGTIFVPPHVAAQVHAAHD